jgi:hypothetical protein
MKSSVRARSAMGVAALLTAAPMTGCNAQDSPETIEAVSEPSLSVSSSSPGPPAGTAAAKGAELTAVATVRAWVAARNASGADVLAGRECETCARYLGDGRWRVESARVSRHTVESATVVARIRVTAETQSRERLTFAFEVTRIAGSPRVTKIDAVP